MAKVDKSGIQDHPLFPFEDDEEPKEIAFIQVIRHEDGRSKQVPRMFRADELTSLQDIHALFGGGLYELWGRGRSINDPQRCGRIASVRRYEIAGISKPLVDDGSNAPTNSAPIAPHYVPPVAPAGQATPDTSVMGMFMQMQMAMMQQSQETARQQAEAQRRADERARADSQQMMQMIATMQAQSTQSMMGVVTAMVSSSRGGGGAEDMAKYVDLFTKMGIVAKPGGDVEPDGGGGLGTILSDLADVVQGAVQLKEGGGLSGIVAPPGSAAALFGVKPPGQGGGAPPTP